mgnify:CR=1 FL=1
MTVATASPWHVKWPHLLQKTLDEMSARFPGLQSAWREGRLEFTGRLTIADQKGELGSFDIRIAIPDQYPDTLPLVFETSKRIPRISRRHIYPDGSCCVGTELDLWVSQDETTSLADFAESVVVPYFVGQLLVEEGAPWPQGERAHGRDGIWQSLLILTQTHSRGVALRILRLLENPKPPGQSPCPCGNGKRLRDCCSVKIRKLQESVTPKRASKLLSQLMD